MIRIPRIAARRRIGAVPPIPSRIRIAPGKRPGRQESRRHPDHKRKREDNFPDHLLDVSRPARPTSIAGH
jgi:hypothetical protein